MVMLKSIRLLFVVFVLLSGLQLFSATIVYKPNKESEPKRISKVKIISITKNIIVVEKDGARTNIAVGQLVEYLDSDMDNAGEGMDDNTCEYTISLHKIDMPKTGYVKNGGTKKSDVSECEIQYSIVRDNKDGTDYNRVKEPYFYLFVLVDHDDGNGGRGVLKYGFPPDRAKLTKGEGYDKASIVKQVTSLNRHVINFDNVREIGSGNINKTMTTTNERIIKIKLTNIKDRRIIAYHIEAWGKKDIAGVKDWKDFGVKVDNNWWLRY
jgi:hypothetical protein